jgi:meiotic recombination protein REC8, fungi type
LLFEDDMLAMREDEHILLDPNPFSPRTSADQEGATQHARHTTPAQPPQEETPSTAISAPQRRARAPKLLDFDDRPGLTNDDLRQWNEGYLINMNEAADARHLKKLTHQAKKNAEHWVLGRGIGGVGSGLGQDHVVGPLQFFSGVGLLAALTGRELSPAGSKRGRSPSATSAADEEERRVRVREENEGQVGRGAVEDDLTIAGQDEGVFVGDDEMVRIPYGTQNSRVADRYRRISKWDETPEVSWRDALLKCLGTCIQLREKVHPVVSEVLQLE